MKYDPTPFEMVQVSNGTGTWTTGYFIAMMPITYGNHPPPISIRALAGRYLCAIDGDVDELGNQVFSVWIQCRPVNIVHIDEALHIISEKKGVPFDSIVISNQRKQKSC